MLIQEIVRSCASERVAEAAVVSIGRSFSSKIAEVASTYDMSVGAFTALSVHRFIRHGDEGELRAVMNAMTASQEPVLAGLHRILCIMLAAGAPAGEGRVHERAPRLTAQLAMLEMETTRRGAYC